MPQASAAAPQQLCVAYLVSPQRMQVVAADAHLQAAVMAPADGLPRARVRMFSDEGEAVRWLADCPC